jgi:hypothetical protein
MDVSTAIRLIDEHLNLISVQIKYRHSGSVYIDSEYYESALSTNVFRVRITNRNDVSGSVSDSGSENAKYIDVSTFTEDDLKAILIVLTPPLVWGRFK